MHDAISDALHALIRLYVLVEPMTDQDRRRRLDIWAYEAISAAVYPFYIVDEGPRGNALRDLLNMHVDDEIEFSAEVLRQYEARRRKPRSKVAR